MKKSISLSVKNPCSQNFESFKKSRNGGFCQDCDVNVVDFSSMSDDEVLSYYFNSASPSCGRFRKDQLKSFEIPSSEYSPGAKTLKWIQAGLIGLTVFFTVNNITAKTYNADLRHQSDPIGKVSLITNQLIELKVEGVVYDEDHEPMAGVNVVLKGSNVGTVTDMNGHFSFPRELKNGDVLHFSFIGYEDQTVIIGNSSPSFIEINLEMDSIMVLGDVDVAEVYESNEEPKKSIWKKMKEAFRK